MFRGRFDFHDLFLSNHADDQNRCSFCQKVLEGGPFYFCKRCSYRIHKSCAELPLEINHHFHQPHSLKLCLENSFVCDSCNITFLDDLCFRCFGCDFYLDVKCALMSDIDMEGQEFIRHFSRREALIMYRKHGQTLEDDPAFIKQFPDLICGRILRVSFLHKPSPNMLNPWLAMHPVLGINLEDNYCLCNFCNIHTRKFKFCCNICQFVVHASCFFESASKKEAQNQEMLRFFCNDQDLQSQSCIDSKYIINQSYIQFPEWIYHGFHLHKPLEFLHPKSFRCDSCHKWFYKQLCYGCEDCNFQMDVRCSLMPSIQYDESCEYRHSFLPRHLNHQHRLHLITEVSHINCSVCQTTQASPIYGCTQCKYFLHESCIELPTKIKHPLHGRHMLFLQPFSSKSCDVCLRSYIGLFFECIECEFSIGIECAFGLRPSVMCKYHDHLLCLVEKMQDYCICADEDTFCQVSKSLSLESKHTRSYLIRCVECNYNLHLLCGPLPCTIKHKGHVHAMTLVDSVVEDASGDYYCDICEEARDPRLCAYYCKECKFISHVHCVILEVIKALKGDPGEVKMRVVGDWTIEDKHGLKNHLLDFESDSSDKKESLGDLTLLDVLDSLSLQEVDYIKQCFNNVRLVEHHWQDYKEQSAYGVYYYLPEQTFDDGNVIFNTGGRIGLDFESRDNGIEELKGDDSDLIHQISFYDDYVLTSLIDKMSSFITKTKHLIHRGEQMQKVVGVGGYMIPSNYSEVLLTLFKKYGDLSIKSPLSQDAKSVIFYLLCRVLNQMIRIQIADTTEQQLLDWNYYLVGVKRAGFKMDFVADAMHRIMTTYVGVQAMKFERTLNDGLEKEIAKADERIAKLRQKLQESTKYRDGNGMLSENSKVVAACIREAKILQWKTWKDFF